MSPAVLTMRLLLAAGLGAAIGIERELRGKPAGLRTNILIAVGAALFTTVSLQVGARLGRRIASPRRLSRASVFSALALPPLENFFERRRGPRNANRDE